MALVLNDLWIGDDVVIKSSNKLGKFVGISKDGRARISVDNKILLIQTNNLELYVEKENFPHHLLADLIEDKKPKDSQKIKVNIDHTIDLHFEKLAPEMQADPRYILTYQLQKCKEFLDQAIEKKYPYITIIHGKGQGILRQEVEQLLKSYTNARFKFPKNDGGAIEVWL